MEQYISIPLGVPLSRHAGCVFFFLVMRRRPFSNWHSTYSCIYSAILKIHLAAKSEKKQEKEEKRKHDSGKLSDGDQIDVMIII